MKVVVHKVRVPRKVKVRRVHKSAVDRRRKLELHRMIDTLHPALYDDAKSHLTMLLAVL